VTPVTTERVQQFADFVIPTYLVGAVRLAHTVTPAELQELQAPFHLVGMGMAFLNRFGEPQDAAQRAVVAPFVNRDLLNRYEEIVAILREGLKDKSQSEVSSILKWTTAWIRTEREKGDDASQWDLPVGVWALSDAAEQVVPQLIQQSATPARSGSSRGCAVVVSIVLISAAAMVCGAAMAYA
jgi:hypothetical protein